MRAIIFSNYPNEEFDRSWRPRLEERGVEIVRVKSMVHNNGAVGLGAHADVPLVVSVSGLMSKDQRNRVREAAKKSGKMYYDVNPLAGEISWRQLDVLQKVEPTKTVSGAPNLRLVSAAPIEAREMEVAPDTSMLTPDAPQPRPSAVELDAAQMLLEEAQDQITALQSQKTDLESQLAAQKRANVAISSERDRAQKALKAAQDELNIAKDAVPDLVSENKRLAAQVEELSKNLIAARAETPAPSLHLDNLFKSLDALKLLVKNGLMDPNEAFEKLANFKPKP